MNTSPNEIDRRTISVVKRDIVKLQSELKDIVKEIKITIIENQQDADESNELLRSAITKLQQRNNELQSKYDSLNNHVRILNHFVMLCISVMVVDRLLIWIC